MGWSSCVALLPSLDNLSASSFPLMSQCAGIHCITRFVFWLKEVSSLLILRINSLWSLLPCTLWSTDLQSVRITAFAGSGSEEFNIVIASRRAQAPAGGEADFWNISSSVTWFRALQKPLFFPSQVYLLPTEAFAFSVHQTLSPFFHSFIFLVFFVLVQSSANGQPISLLCKAYFIWCCDCLVCFARQFCVFYVYAR